MEPSGPKKRGRGRKSDKDKSVGLQADSTMMPDVTSEVQSKPSASAPSSSKPAPRSSPRIQHRLRLRAPPVFHGFEKLPPELRAKIWDDAIPGPRVIQVKAKIVASKFSLHQRGVHFKSSTPVPAMLHASPESRRVALRHYRLSMRSHLSGPHIYVDFNRDTVYFGQINVHEGFTLSCLLRDMPHQELSKIRHLGVSQEVWNCMASCNAHVLVDFPSLQSVTLVMERPRAATSKSAVFVEPEPGDTSLSHFSNLEFPDLDPGYFWPEEVEDVITENLLAVYEGDEDDPRQMPLVEFMVLDPADNLKAKPKKRAKGKARSVSSLR